MRHVSATASLAATLAFGLVLAVAAQGPERGISVVEAPPRGEKRVALLMSTARNRLNIVVLDACRDNPFARTFRSSARGLASIDAPTGTLIAYATAPGRTARDGEGTNGLYTGELVKVMTAPGLKIEEMFRDWPGCVWGSTRWSSRTRTTYQQSPQRNPKGPDSGGPESCAAGRGTTSR